MRIFKATYRSTESSITCRDYAGTRRDLRFGDSVLITESQLEWFKLRQVFEIEEIDLNSLISRAKLEVEEGMKPKLKVSQVRPPSQRASLLAIFPEEEPLLIQRWFFCQLLRLSISDFAVFVQASAVPSFLGRNYLAMQNVRWVLSRDFVGPFDWVAGLSKKVVETFAKKFDAMPLLLDPSKSPFDFFVPSERFLLSRKTEDSKSEGALILATHDVSSTRSILDSRGIRSAVTFPSSNDWQNDSSRSEMLSYRGIFINFQKSKVPCYEIEAKICGCIVLSVNDSEFTDFYFKDEKELIGLFSNEDWKSMLKTTSIPPTKLSPISESDILPMDRKQKKVEPLDILIIHRPSLRMTGADKSTLMLLHHLREEKGLRVGLLLVSKSRKHSLSAEGGVTVTEKELYTNPDLIASARLYIVSDSLVRPLKQSLPPGNTIVFLHFLGGLCESLPQALETFFPDFLTGLKVYCPSKHLAEELQNRYHLDTEHLVPFYDWKRLESARGSKEEASIVFVPVLYGDDKDLKFMRDLATALPEINFLIGDLRGNASYFADLKNVEVEFQTDVVQTLMKTRCTLIFSSFGITFSISAWESLAAGVPVIAEDVGALKDLPSIFRLPRDVDKWAFRIREIFQYQGQKWGGIKTSCIHAFNNYMKRVRDWDEAIDSFLSKDAAGFKFSHPPYAGVVGAFSAMEYVVGTSEIPLYSIMEKPQGGVAYIASTLTQLHLDGQIKLIKTAEERLKTGQDAVVICPDYAVVNLLNSLLGEELAFTITLPVRPIRADIKKVRPDRVSILFRTIASRKLFLWNALLASEAGILSIDIDEATPNDWVDIARRLRLSVTRHGLYTFEKYAELLSSVAAGLQFTYGESFNYTAFEHFLSGTPCLVSQQTRCIFELTDDWHWMIIKEENLLEAVEKLKKACHLEFKERKALADQALRVARRLNQRFRSEISRILPIIRRRRGGL